MLNCSTQGKNSFHSNSPPKLSIPTSPNAEAHNAKNLFHSTSKLSTPTSPNAEAHKAKNLSHSQHEEFVPLDL